MIYVVSGYMRTGTSMMMQALGAGGLTIYSNQDREGFNEKYGDEQYLPNKGGFHELTDQDVLCPEYDHFAGFLIKMLIPQVCYMPVNSYRVVVMMRDPEEIRQSYEGFFYSGTGKRKDEAMTMINTAMADYYNWMRRALAALHNRKDMEVTVLWYRDVVEHPYQELSKLRHWSFDVEAAAKVIDPAQCRFKREQLIGGL